MLFRSRSLPTKVRIIGNFEDNEWVVFKEQYFSRWKAFMNGKEIPVYASNNELILINTIKGDTIMLEYSILSKERLIGILSFIGLLSLATFFIFILYESKKELDV